jgi:glycosyltransferase involved in cell wall biosynthesis
LRVVHLVVTDAFAGTERYVVDVASELSRVGHDVTVVGGQAERMQCELASDVGWRPGSNIPQALRSMTHLRDADVVHCHMTYAEAVVAATPRLRARVVATRHFAAERGASIGGRLVRPLLRRRIDLEIGISAFVAAAGGSPTDLVIPNGVRPSADLFDPRSRVVTVAQRLEREKDTRLAVEAWRLSGLYDDGWELHIAGDGTEGANLREEVRRAAVPGVRFLGRVSDMTSLWKSTGMLMASAPAEPFGLAVVEAMAAGIPIVAAAAGGHLETVGAIAGAPLFPAGDAVRAAALAAELAADVDRRRRLGQHNREWQRLHATIEGHVRQLVSAYDAVLAGRSRRTTRAIVG